MGAAFGASLYFVLGTHILFQYRRVDFAFGGMPGGLLSTLLVLARSRQGGHSSVITLLLTGLTINALFLSGVGFMSYIARDPQARSITFWNLGTLSGNQLEFGGHYFCDINSLFVLGIALYQTSQCPYDR